MDKIKVCKGGVTAPKGFLASGIHCGIRKNKDKKDLALIFSKSPAAAAAVYTENLVKGAPLIISKENLSKTKGIAQAIICNSGNANTCNADGLEVALEMCKLAGEGLSINKESVIVASTGVIGQSLDISPIASGMKELVGKLGDNSLDAANAIMTTDLNVKEIAVSFYIGGVECKIGGIAKGSGMIHPNMATMLAFLTSDIKISPELLQKALSADVEESFNMVSVDGDTSTNDMVTILANGYAENKEILEGTKEFETFKKALSIVTKYLSRQIAKDGEGATKLLTCLVSGAKDRNTAKLAAKAVICSSLVKTAMFGADANWGRVLCALGYSSKNIDADKIDLSFASGAGQVEVCKKGKGIDFSEDKAKAILLEDEIDILVDLNDGKESAKAWGCDLSYDYVKINGDYRT